MLGVKCMSYIFFYMLRVIIFLLFLVGTLATINSLIFPGVGFFIGLSATCWFLWNMTILLLPNNKKGIEGFDKLQFFNSNFKRTIPWMAGGVILADFGGIIFGTW